MIEGISVLVLPMGNRHYDCLIGRDILSRGVFVYNGPNDAFSLTF